MRFREFFIKADVFAGVFMTSLRNVGIWSDIWWKIDYERKLRDGKLADGIEK
jgi:hypothetical protein